MDNLEPEIRTQEEAFDKSFALNKVMADVMHERHEERRHTEKIFAALLTLSILINLIIVGAFLWYESQWEVTETIEAEQETGEGENGSNTLTIGDVVYTDEFEKAGE